MTVRLVLGLAATLSLVPLSASAASSGTARIPLPVAFAFFETLQAPAADPAPDDPRDLVVTVGKSLVMDSPVNIERVSVADGALAEAIAVTPRQVLINGRQAGETSLIIWQQGGNRLFFDLSIRPSTLRVDAVRRQLQQELGGQPVTLDVEGENVFLRGTVNDVTAARRAVAVAGTLGTPVNLLHVRVPEVEPQILLKVRFANVDRAALQELGVNLFSTGALNTVGVVTTGQFTSPRVDAQPDATRFTLTDALNIFLFRRDLDLGATIRAMQSKRVVQMLAEPNLLAINGSVASFLAGGEFPFPTLQGGGAGIGQVTVQFREFGVRLNFLPTLTPRGTIRLQVMPEVSALDYANGLVLQGFTVPGLSTRRVQTEVELESGQSFALAGLLDNRVTEVLSKIPGLGDIPVLGKLFQSRALNKNNTELLVLVTPELVRPVPAGQPVPVIQMPRPWLDGAATLPPRTPGIETTGPVPIQPPHPTVPAEQLMEEKKQAAPAPSMGPVQFIPVPVAPPPQQQSPAVALPGTAVAPRQ